MKQKVPCSQCSEDAVAELFNQALCPGCLMRILACEDGAMPVHRLDGSPPKPEGEKIEAVRTV